MRSPVMAIALFGLAFDSFAQHGGQPAPLESRIISLGLFKNGLAVVKREVKIDGAGPGVYEVAAVPDPVHGTFWIESDAAIATRVTTREIESPPDTQAGWDVQRELAGGDVVIHLKVSGAAPVAGRVMEFGGEQSRQWDRMYETDAYGRTLPNLPSGGSYATNVAAGSAPRFIVVETRNGRTYVDAASIATIDATGTPEPVKRRQSMLVFTVMGDDGAANAPKPLSIFITYLAKGLTWAPAYRIDITESKSLRLEQQAVLRNELEDLRDVEVQLISGYPNIEFAHVNSPLSMRTNLAAFFRQLSQRSNWFTSGPVTQQRASYAVEPDPGSELAVPPAGEGWICIIIQSDGRR